jgi:phenylalanine-4-hydroxylase
MTRNINLTGHLGPQVFLDLFEAMGLELNSKETRVQEHGQVIQTDTTWHLGASPVFVQLTHGLVEAGSPRITYEDNLSAVVHTHQPDQPTS